MKSELSYLEMDAELQAQAAVLANRPPLAISVLRNVTVEPIELYLRHAAYTMGFNAAVRFGGYGTVLQEATDPRNVWLETSGAVLVFITLDNLSWNLARNLNGLSASQAAEESEYVKNYLASSLKGIRERTKAPILWHSFETPVHPGLDRQKELIGSLNRYLSDLLKGCPNAHYVDLDACVGRLGHDRFYDRRLWHIGRVPYSRAAFKEIAGEVFGALRPVLGRTKKCLVLDCDNVLWGGVVGEAGLDGIKLGRDYPGSPYYEFQQEILNLHRGGLLLALCSRNNEADVLEVLDRHPDMLIRREHLSAYEIHWEGKVVGLQRIAQKLNIHPDSLVFADDSEFEIGSVLQALPEVLTLHLPADKSVEFRDRLLRLGCFGAASLSEEDRTRGELYRREDERKKHREVFEDQDAYLRSLGLVATIRAADALSIPRIAQLTQKTNQFNLTTRRYTEDDIRRFSADPDHCVMTLAARDKFGESGLVGVFIAKRKGDEAEIDTLLMSCRVLGRRLEWAFVNHCLASAEARWGVREWTASYLPTAKNAQVAAFWESFGFKGTARPDGAVEYSLCARDRTRPDDSLITVEGEVHGRKS